MQINSISKLQTTPASVLCCLWKTNKRNKFVVTLLYWKLNERRVNNQKGKIIFNIFRRQKVELEGKNILK